MWRWRRSGFPRRPGWRCWNYIGPGSSSVEFLKCCYRRNIHSRCRHMLSSTFLWFWLCFLMLLVRKNYWREILFSPLWVRLVFVLEFRLGCAFAFRLMHRSKLLFLQTFPCTPRWPFWFPFIALKQGFLRFRKCIRNRITVSGCQASGQRRWPLLSRPWACPARFRR